MVCILQQKSDIMYIEMSAFYNSFTLTSNENRTLNIITGSSRYQPLSRVTVPPVDPWGPGSYRASVSACVRMRNEEQGPVPQAERPSSPPPLHPEIRRSSAAAGRNDREDERAGRLSAADPSRRGWHKNPDKWPSLKWRAGASGFFLFCFSLYRVRVFFFLKWLSGFMNRCSEQICAHTDSAERVVKRSVILSCCTVVGF